MPVQIYTKVFLAFNCGMNSRHIYFAGVQSQLLFHVHVSNKGKYAMAVLYRRRGKLCDKYVFTVTRYYLIIMTCKTANLDSLTL